MAAPVKCIGLPVYTEYKMQASGQALVPLYRHLPQGGYGQTMAHRMDIAIRHGNCETAQVGARCNGLKDVCALGVAAHALERCIGLIAASENNGHAIRQSTTAETRSPE